MEKSRKFEKVHPQMEKREDASARQGQLNRKSGWIKAENQKICIRKWEKGKMRLPVRAIEEKIRMDKGRKSKNLHPQMGKRKDASAKIEDS